MDRTSALNYVTILGKRYYQDENLVGGVQGTEIVAADRNAVQEEILGVVEGVGKTPSGADNLQLFKAIKRMAGGNLGATITASTALTADNAGWVIVDATSANIVLTLPLAISAGGVPFEFRIARIDSSSHTVTLAFSGSDALLVPAPIAVGAGQVLYAGASGGTTWINFLELGTQSLVAAGGWERRPSGIIEQWGQGATTTGNGDTITFPIPFPTACAGVVINERNAVGWNLSGGSTEYGPSNASTTDFKLYAWNRNATGTVSLPSLAIAFFYRAIGW